MLVTFLLLALNTIIYFADGMTLGMLFFNYAKYLVATFLAPVAMALFVMLIEKKPIKPMIKGVLLFPVFMGTWIVINIKCIIKPNTKWEKIEHKRNVKIDDMSAK